MHTQNIVARIAKSFICLILMFSILVVAHQTAVADDPRIGGEIGNEQQRPRQFEPNQLVVKFATGDESDMLSAISVSGSIAFQLSTGAFLIQYDEPVDLSTEMESLEKLSGIEYAHPNFLLNSLHPVQGSLPFADQAGTGDYEGQPPATMTNLPEAQQLVTGSGVVVGLLDGGVDFSHSGLLGQVVSVVDLVDEDADAYDVAGGNASGHGTFVAGVIQLVAPDAVINTYRIFDSSGYGDGFTLARGIEQAVYDGCDVINLSVALALEHKAVNDAIDLAVQSGVTVIAAAGNEGNRTPIFPAAYPAVVAVGAIDTIMIFSTFSTYGSQIDVVAPGEGVYSTYQNNGYAWWSGTSFAAPFVTGQAALLKERRPSATPLEIAHAIIQTGTSIDLFNPSRAGEMGSGLVDFAASLHFIDTLPTAEILPDTFFFTAEVGADYFAPFFANAFLTSSNAPAAYTVELEPADPLFTFISDQAGVTDDSVFMEVNPSFQTVGEFSNTVKFHVDGVVEPVSLTITVTVQEPPDEVVVTPSTLMVQASIFTDVIIARTVFVSTLNAPDPFTVEIPSSISGLVSATSLSGMTNDSVTFLFNPSNALSPGIYIDTVWIRVDGIERPGAVAIIFEVLANNPDPTVWVEPREIFITPGQVTGGVISRIVFLFSDSSSASYSVSVNTRAQDYLTAFSASGSWLTPDSVEILITTPNLPGSGVFQDTVFFHVTGSTSPGVLLVNFNLDATASVTVTPSSSFWLTEGSNEVVSGCINVFDQQPSPYSVTVLQPAKFLHLNDTSGVTDGSSCFQIAASELTLAPGIYTDSFFVIVSGQNYPIVHEINLVIHADTAGGDETANVIPISNGFEAIAGEVSVLTGTVHVLSTNAPSPFSVSLLDTIGTFTTLLSSGGFTNDSIVYRVDVPADMPIGVYADTLLFWVDGTSNSPRISVIYLHVDTVFGLASASATPAFQAFTVSDGIDTVISGNIVITSANAPSPYTIALSDSSSAFTTLLTSSGLTNDTAFFELNVTSSMPTGLYIDTLRVNVEGAIVNLGHQFAVVYLQIDSTMPDTGGGPIASVSPTLQRFTVTEGTEPALAGNIFVSSTNAPAAYIVSVLDSGSQAFVSFGGSQTTSGNSNDSVHYNITNHSLFPVGLYTDSLIVVVEGAVNNPRLSVVELVVVAADTGGGGGGPIDTAFVTPTSFSFQTPVGTSNLWQASLNVTSTNAPSLFVAFTASPFSFITIPDSIGITNDSLLFEVKADSSLAPGWYQDTIVVSVADVVNPQLIVLVDLLVAGSDSTSPGGGKMTLENFPNPFNPSTNIRFSLPEFGHVQLTVYNIVGQVVTRLVDEDLPAGEHTVTLNSAGMPSGIYFYRLQTESEGITRKMMLIK